LYSLFLNPMGLRDLQNLQWTALLLPLLGLASLERAGAPDGARRWLLPATATALALLLRAPTDARALGLADDWSSEDLGAVALAAAPAEAVVLPASDSLIASTLFLQVAGDARPDLYLIGRSQASREASLRYLDARQPFSLLSEPPESGDLADLRPRFGRLLTRATEAGHAVLWERLTRDTDLPAATELTDCWPLAIIGSAGSCPADRRVGSGRLDVAFGESAMATSGAVLPPYRNWLAELQGARGSDAARVGDWGSALPSFAAAATLAPSSSRLSNLAVALANLGRTDEAFSVLEAAWPLYPQSTKLCGNAAAVPTANPELRALWAERCPAQPSE
jgi:tetratricopeptide (TPR) repeat protein